MNKRVELALQTDLIPSVDARIAHAESEVPAVDFRPFDLVRGAVENSLYPYRTLYGIWEELPLLSEGQVATVLEECKTAARLSPLISRNNEPLFCAVDRPLDKKERYAAVRWVLAH